MKVLNYFSAHENAQNLRDWAYMTSLAVALQEKCFTNAPTVCADFAKILTAFKGNFIGKLESSDDLAQNFRSFGRNAKEYVSVCALGETHHKIDPDMQFTLSYEACTIRANQGFKLLFSEKKEWETDFWRNWEPMVTYKCFRDDKNAQIAVQQFGGLEKLGIGQVALRDNFYYLLRNHASTPQEACSGILEDIESELRLVDSREVSRAEGSKILNRRKSHFDDYKVCVSRKAASDFCKELVENSKSFLAKMLLIEDEEKYYNDVTIFLGDLPTVAKECEPKKGGPGTAQSDK
eukprot:TRINITY_DN3855_c0_g2_i3.p1 TRINITY_DN3855_c0_g2~~TRINITY_DN3855_c0_g2_i3.p1  ORF type:complete len:292 (+),score=80.30 TRINITY_DN3855_c0_g2_i3:538-1413(+)